jgi:outer membrane receptor for ferrienterochelin and colicin
MRHYRPLLLAVLCTCVGASAVYAGSTGKISGVVKDAGTKETIPGVAVIVQGTKLGASTNVDGQYVILNVPPGQYSLVVSHIGYKRYELNGLRVSVDFTTTANIELEEGSVEMEAVVVQGERTPLIRPDLTNPVASIGSETIEALPVTEISEIIGLQAGVTVGDDGVIHIRGGYGNEIAYTLNGVSVNNPYGNDRSINLATNAVQEVSVSSGTFNAEYGGALSGVVNYVTKEGGSHWTGGAKYYTGDYVSTNKELFFHIDDFNPTSVNRTEVTLGGPIIGDKLTFYGSGVYNWNRGTLFGQRLYLPEDSYLSREGFPTNDPRKGAASAPYYFGPARHDTTDMVGLPGGDGAVVSLNWSRSYNVQGNLSYRISPEMRLKGEFIYDFSEKPESDAGTFTYSDAFSNRFKPDGRAIRKDDQLIGALEFTHSLSSRAFYTLKASYNVDIRKSAAYDDINDRRYLPSFYLQSFPNTSYLTGGVEPVRFQRKTKTFAAKFDLVAQLFENHEVKFGVEARWHKLFVQLYTLQFRDPNDTNAVASFSNMIANGNVFLPYVPTAAGGLAEYTRYPVNFASYIQDKIELFKSIILNLGLRYEMFRPAADYNPALSQELSSQDTIFVDKNLVSASTKHMLSPRLSVSYPITDQGTIRFSYGHFYQIGSLSSLYRNPFFRAPLGTTPSFGNPEVNPQKSVQYELGLQQGLTQDVKIEVTAYYKDVSDYIYSQRIITARGDKQYNLLTNLSYANTRGVSISLLKRRAPEDIFSASIDYTFQTVEGNRTEPTDQVFFNEQQGRLSETFLVPLSFDRSHTITSTITLNRPNDWAVSMIGYFRTGTPYTPAFPSSVVPISFTQGSDRQPVQWNVDLKAEKFFRFGSIDYSVFLQVDNLFDVENELSVYANSGRALYNISETLEPYLFNDLRYRIAERMDPGMIPISAVDRYYANPANVSSPRLVRIGASIVF